MNLSSDSAGPGQVGGVLAASTRALVRAGVVHFRREARGGAVRPLLPRGRRPPTRVDSPSRRHCGE